MKHDLTLKFIDEAQAIEVLSQFRTEDKEWMQGNHDFALTYCGSLYENNGVYDEEGSVVTPPTPIEGYHINLQTDDDDLSEALSVFKVYPTDRKVGWAKIR